MYSFSDRKNSHDCDNTGTYTLIIQPIRYFVLKKAVTIQYTETLALPKKLLLLLVDMTGRRSPDRDNLLLIPLNCRFAVSLQKV